MDAFYNLFSEFHIGTIPRAILFIIIGFFISRLVSLSADKAFRTRLRPHQVMILRRAVFYAVFALFLISAFQELGFHISTLLGATGILTVGFTFASQTSMSNLVSGIFIIGEKPFEIGDSIKVNEVQGEVLSIDFLSVKIRTPENTMVRIPNETLIKSSVTNLSFFPMRRVDLVIGIAYKEDLDIVRKILLKIAKDHPLCLDDPTPFIGVENLGDSTVNIQYQVWGNRDHYKELKSSIQADIKNAFLENNITMPFPSRSLYAGNGNDALPVKIINNA